MKTWPKFSLILREGFVELGARDLVDLLDGLHGVLDGLHEVLALRLEEAVPLGGLLVFVERHHVDWAHLLDALAQRAASFLFGDELFVGRRTISTSARSTGASTFDFGRGSWLQGIRGRNGAWPPALDRSARLSRS